MCTSFLQDIPRFNQPALDFFFRKRTSLFECIHVHVVAVTSDTYSPTAGFKRFTDTRNGIVNLNHRLNWVNIHQIEISINHKRLGSGTINHFVSCHGCIWSVPLFFRILFKDVYHASYKTCRTPNFDTFFLKFLSHLCDVGKEGGILPETGELHWDKILKHIIHITLIRILTVYRFPALTNFRNLGQLKDVKVLAQPHRPSCFRHADFNIIFFKNIYKHHGRGKYVFICSGATPVQYKPFDFSTVATGVNVI